MKAEISRLLHTMVLMPWEKGRSWINPGTKLKVTRAEQKVLLWAVVKRRRIPDETSATHHVCHMSVGLCDKTQYFGLFYIDGQTAAKPNYTSMLHNPWRTINSKSDTHIVVSWDADSPNLWGCWAPRYTLGPRLAGSGDRPEVVQPEKPQREHHPRDYSGFLLGRKTEGFRHISAMDRWAVDT